MLRIQMEQQFSKLGLEIQDPQIQLETTKPQIQLSTEAVKVEIHTEPGVLEIDQSPCRRVLFHKTSAEFMQDYAEAGKQAALEVVGVIASEGDRMGRIESHEDAIVNMAIEKNIEEPGELAWVPIDPPIINYHPGKVVYNVQAPQVDLQLVRGTVENNFQRGSVEVYMLQRPDLKIWTIGDRVDQSI